MKRTLNLLLVTILTIAGIVLLNLPMLTSASEASHAVISEIKITGGTGRTTDEFVELYNPTSADVSLNGWQLIKKTSSGSNYVLMDNFGDKTIAAHSFFLVAHPTGYLGSTAPDVYYSATNSVSDNNTVILYNATQEAIDKVGFGTATDVETEAVANPSSGKSLERKARADSTVEMMVEGGTHYFLGNSEDSDNNKNDFIGRDTPEPQNSASEPEYSELAPPPEPPAPDTPEPPQEPAYSKNIIINEIFPNPIGTDDVEFIELYNAGDTPVDLTGWKLSDATARFFVISREDFSSTVVAPHGYFVVEKKISAISLNNTSDAAKLYHPDGTLVNSVEYSNCPEGMSYNLIDGGWRWSDQITPGGQNALLVKNILPVASFEIVSAGLKVGAKILFDASDSTDDDDDTLTYAWYFGDGTISSGKKIEHTFQKAGIFIVRLTVSDGRGGEDEAEEKIEITDYDYSNTLLINELLPACRGSDADCEYIEIYNPENRRVRLDGWRLTDNRTTYIFPNSVTIESRGFLMVKQKDSKIVLNNTGDTLFLINPRGIIINGVEYIKAKDDLSFSRINTRQWQWTEKQTPGSENEFSQEGEEELRGEMVIGGEDEKAQKVAEDLSAVITPIAEATEDKLGSILKISAEVESVNGSNIYLVDEAGNTLRVYIQKATGIKKPELKSGNKVEITGVLDKTAAGLRLLPRKQEDIKIVSNQDTGWVLGTSTEKEVIDVPIKDRSKQVKMYLLVGAGVLVLGVVIVAAKKRAKQLKIER